VPIVFRRLFFMVSGCLLALVMFPQPTYSQKKPAPAKSDPAKVFAELKIFKDGSPIRRPIEDWDGAKKRVASDPDWQRWLRDRRAELDDWMAKRRDRAEWNSGWWHDFVSPKNGSSLKFTPDVPGDYLASASDPQVKVTPKIFDAWVSSFRGNHASRMLDAARLYRLTGDTKYAKWAAEQLDFYASNYAKWPLKTQKGKCRIGYQSLDEANLLIRYVSTAYYLGDSVTPTQKKRWLTQLFLPAADLLEQSFQQLHNIACWQRSAEAHVALYANDTALWQKAVDGPFGIRKQLAGGVTADYFWFEQSLGYNQYVVTALIPFFTYASLEGKDKTLRKEMQILENLLLSPISLRFPTGQLPNPADSTGGLRSVPDRGAMAAAYRLFPTAIGLAQAAKWRTWETLLDPPGTVPAEPPLPPVQSRHLAGTRMALLKKNKWQVFLHYGQLDASHAQAEALNFEAFYGDVEITHDPGTVGYGSPLHKNYYATGLAHNVPLVNGLGQAKWHPGQMSIFDLKTSRMMASQPVYQPGVTAQREMKIDGERLIDVVTVNSQGSPRVGLVLHIQGKATLPSGFKEDRQFANPERPEGFRQWQDPRTASGKKTISLDVAFGPQRMRLTFAASGPFTITHATTPDAPPAKRESFYLETVGTMAWFKTIFEPAGSTP
jgi:hypothetical protein